MSRPFSEILVLGGLSNTKQMDSRTDGKKCPGSEEGGVEHEVGRRHFSSGRWTALCSETFRVCVHVVEVDKGVSTVPGAGVRRAWVPASVHTCLAV